MKAHLAAVFLMTWAVGALGQGAFVLDDSDLANGLAVDAPSNWYSGTFGMEVWMLNSTSVPAGINLSPAPGAGILGYDAMTAAGFIKEATFGGPTGSVPGAFGFAEVDMPPVTPAGATVVLALAAWSTSAPSWGAMLANASPATRAGIVAFLQPTSDYTAIGAPPSPAPLAMDRDLVMTSIPEPSGLALAGLGGVLLLLSRRRGGLAEPGWGGLQKPAPWRRPLPPGGTGPGPMPTAITSIPPGVTARELGPTSWPRTQTTTGSRGRTPTSGSRRSGSDQLDDA